MVLLAAVLAPVAVFARDGGGDFGPVRLLVFQALLFLLALGAAPASVRVRWAGMAVMAWGVAAAVAALAIQAVEQVMVRDLGTWHTPVAAGLGLLATACAAHAALVRHARPESGATSLRGALACGLLGVAVLGVVSQPPMLGALVKLLLPQQIAGALAAGGCAALPGALWLQRRFGSDPRAAIGLPSDTGSRFMVGLGGFLVGIALASADPLSLSVDFPDGRRCPPGEVVLGTGPDARCGRPSYRSRLSPP